MCGNVAAFTPLAVSALTLLAVSVFTSLAVLCMSYFRQWFLGDLNEESSLRIFVAHSVARINSTH